MSLDEPAAKPIRTLQPGDARKLCAGQLVVDAADVVKELVENALDAGATNVVVSVSKNMDLIQVKDNGSGIAKSGRHLLGQAHCTSKIATFEQLYEASTLGFRGEALHLIAEAAGELEIVTKTAEEAVGESLSFAGGRWCGAPRPAPSATGTTVKVSNLFARFPVRLRQHAKSLKHTFNKIYKCLVDYAILCPGARIMSSRPFLQKLPAHNYAQVVRRVFGDTLCDQLAPIEHTSEDGLCKFQGLWPRPDADLDVAGLTRVAANDRSFVFINGRPARVAFLERVVTAAFRQGVAEEAAARRFPFLVLFVSMPRDLCDVNLSPDKAELLVSDRERVAQALETALKASWEACRRQGGVPPPAPERAEASPGSPAPAGGAAVAAPSPAAAALKRPALRQLDLAAFASDSFDEGMRAAQPSGAKKPRPAVADAPPAALAQFNAAQVRASFPELRWSDGEGSSLLHERRVHSAAGGPPGLRAVGALDTGFLVCALAGGQPPAELVVMNHFVADELVVYRNLCETLEVPRCDLDQPIALDAEFPQLSAAEREAVERLFARERAAAAHSLLQRCGFVVQWSTHEDGASHVPRRALHLCQVPAEPSIGVDDFVQILRYLLGREPGSGGSGGGGGCACPADGASQDSCASADTCAYRPKGLRRMFEREARRLVAASSRSRKLSAPELVKLFHSAVRGNSTAACLADLRCFHGRPAFERVATLPLNP